MFLDILNKKLDQKELEYQAKHHEFYWFKSYGSQAIILYLFALILGTGMNIFGALFSAYIDPSLSFPVGFILFSISIYGPLTLLISIPFLISLKLGYRWSQILLFIILLAYFLPGFIIVADFVDLFIKIPFFIIFLIILTAFRNRADLAAKVRDIRIEEYSKPIEIS